MLTLFYDAIIIISIIVLISCSSVVQFSQNPSLNFQKQVDYFEEGIASYYSDDFEGKLTASGEVFSQSGLTAAHRTLPFGTLVKVTNLENGSSVVVKINDRGPFIQGRIIDLSKTASQKLGFFGKGLAKVKVEVLK